MNTSIEKNFFKSRTLVDLTLDRSILIKIPLWFKLKIAKLNTVEKLLALHDPDGREGKCSDGKFITEETRKSQSISV